jgi:hypothetical protein
MGRVSQAELERLRGMDVATILPRIAEHVKADHTFVPIKDQASARWHVTARGREYELLSLGHKFYDTRQKRGGGGAIDLVMHLFQIDFKSAVAVLLEVL